MLVFVVFGDYVAGIKVWEFLLVLVVLLDCRETLCVFYHGGMLEVVIFLDYVG